MTEIVYGVGLYNKDIKKHAIEYLKALPDDVTMLVSIGSSGCAIASAMLVLAKKPLVHMQYRKEKEESHSTGRIGCNIGGYNTPRADTRVAIVDDFTTTGKTLANLIDRVEEDELNIRAIIISKVWDNWASSRYKNKIYKYNLIDLELVST